MTETKMRTLLCVLLLIGGITVLWFHKGKPSTEFRTVDLPGDIGSVSIPTDFVAKMEDDATLLVYPRGCESLSFRLSSISFVKKGGDEHGGRAYVRDKAQEKGLEYQEADDRGILTYEEKTVENGTPLILRFWEVGMRNTVVVVSATILRAKRNNAVVRSTLNAVPNILQSIEVARIHRIIESDGRNVETVTETTDRTPSTLVPFSGKEEAWLASSLALARELCRKYSSGGELEPAELDRIFSRWMYEENEKETGESVVNALGAAFGAWLADRYSFSWGVLTDECGTEYVVRHKLGETTAYPIASVRKRIESRQPEFFQNLCLAILDQLKRSE
jgi:hypothetical protein